MKTNIVPRFTRIALLLGLAVAGTPLVTFATHQVVAWGYYPPVVPPGLTNVVAVAAGLDHSLALQLNGTVVAWGDYGVGQTNVPPGLANVVAIAAGDWHN